MLKQHGLNENGNKTVLLARVTAYFCVSLTATERAEAVTKAEQLTTGGGWSAPTRALNPISRVHAAEEQMQLLRREIGSVAERVRGVSARTAAVW